jgi:hypothetical protein
MSALMGLYTVKCNCAHLQLNTNNNPIEFDSMGVTDNEVLLQIAAFSSCVFPLSIINGELTAPKRISTKAGLAST